MIETPWDNTWTAWRLCKTRYANQWDDGEGAYQVGGRWNTKGNRVVYAAADISTAILEVAFHVGFDGLDTASHTMIGFKVLDNADIHVVMPDDLPNPNWLIGMQSSPNQSAYGDNLLAKHPFVLVPSTITRGSWNLLFNPHLAAGKYQLVSSERFALDTRLIKP